MSDTRQRKYMHVEMKKGKEDEKVEEEEKRKAEKGERRLGGKRKGRSHEFQQRSVFDYRHEKFFYNAPLSNVT